jgi:hypothetical protein
MSIRVPRSISRGSRTRVAEPEYKLGDLLTQVVGLLFDHGRRFDHV